MSASTEHQAMTAYWGSESIAPRTLDLSTRWKWVVSFTTPAALSPVKEPLVPIG